MANIVYNEEIERIVIDPENANKSFLDAFSNHCVILEGGNLLKNGNAQVVFYDNRSKEIFVFEVKVIEARKMKEEVIDDDERS